MLTPSPAFSRANSWTVTEGGAILGDVFSIGGVFYAAPAVPPGLAGPRLRACRLAAKAMSTGSACPRWGTRAEAVEELRRFREEWALTAPPHPA